jgi:hypothetical protein
MSQLPLFGAPQVREAEIASTAAGLHRRADSTGSRAAARELVASGRLQSHGEVVIEALRAHPWVTSLELDAFEHRFLAAHGVKDRTEAARRLPGLLKDGLVVRLDPRDNPTLLRCRVCDSLCFRWAVAGADGAELALRDKAAVAVIDRGGEKALAMGAA